MMDTNPENFRRDARAWPCPACGAGIHSVEQLGIHYAKHTEAEKREAWEKTLQERNKFYKIVEIPKGYTHLRDESFNGRFTLE